MNLKYEGLNVRPRQISTRATALGTLTFSAIWAISAGVCAGSYYLPEAGRVSGSGWPGMISNAWLLAVLVSPSIVFAGGLILAAARHQTRFGMVERLALITGLLPVTAGTFLAIWTVRVLVG